ncbi:Bowman-Birk type proteinase inhibitor C-II-like [Tasmannia lanceolata]|uniref:Bowman-Birk type proteinase inhibitor C-II-like n=1 Tax=Tasmannia lanceolata TaxID=3420 RepID=UPI004063C7C1
MNVGFGDELGGKVKREERVVSDFILAEMERKGSAILMLLVVVLAFFATMSVAQEYEIGFSTHGSGVAATDGECCDRCICLRTWPPRCRCLDEKSSSCSSSCTECQCDSSDPPQCTCADWKDHCDPPCIAMAKEN